MNHSDAVNLCRLRATELGGMLLPATTGMFFPGVYRNGRMAPAPNGRPIRVGIPGTADLIGVVHGRPTACEVKVGKDQQSDDQIKFQAAWEASGGWYVIARFEPGDGVEVLEC